MDVRCEKCETTYEFDDSRLTETGVNVKCTLCGNLFRVRRRAPFVTKEIPGLRAVSAQIGVGTESKESGQFRAGSAKERGWLLRLKHTQEVLRFRELTTLRQWILEKRVVRDDDISRGGAVWRRLGQVVELESFFHSAVPRLRTGPSTAQPSAGSSSLSQGAPLSQEPRRLRTGTPGFGVGPVGSIPLSKAGMRAQDDGVPGQQLRLSSTGRTMRPRLQKQGTLPGVTPDQQPRVSAESVGPPLFKAPSLASEGMAMESLSSKPQQALEASAITAPAPAPAHAAAVPQKITDRPSGAIPQHIHSSGGPARFQQADLARTIKVPPPLPREVREAKPAESPRVLLALPGVNDPSARPAVPGPKKTAGVPVGMPALPWPAPSTESPPMEELSSPPGEKPLRALFPEIAEAILRADPVPRSLKPMLVRADPLEADPAERRFLNAGAEEALADELEGTGFGYRRKEGRRMWLVGAALLVGAAAFGGVYHLAQHRSVGSAQTHKGPRQGTAAYDQGRRFFLLDTDEDFQRAHDQFMKAVGADESSPYPVAALAELHAIWARYLRDDAGTAEQAVAPRLQQEAQHHVKSARTYVEQATVLGPATMETNRAVALVLLESGAPTEQVEAALQNAAQTAAPDGELLYVRALLLLSEQREEEARGFLAQALADPPLGQPVLLRAMMLLGELEARTRHTEAAQRLFGDVIKHNVNHVRAQRALRALIAAAADLGSAPPEPTTQEPTTQEPPAPRAAAGDKGPASSVETPGGREPGETGPRDLQGRLGQAQRLLDNERPRDAQRIYQQLLLQFDDSPDVHVGLGACSLDTEHYQAAVEHYRNALRRRADYPPALIGLAEAYKLQGDSRKALEWYRTYLEKDPDGPQASLAHNNIARLEAELPTPSVPPERSPPAKPPDLGSAPAPPE